MTVLGHEVGRDARARKLVGLCPQENVLYPELTARENLEYVAAMFGVPRRERRRRAADVLDGLGLAEKARTRADALSGGMKRRLTLGLALVHDPEVVVLDEPEAGLDPQTRVVVREFIRSLRKERTVVLTSHNMDEVERIADRVAIVDRGRLRVLGTPDELKATLGGGDHVDVHLEDGDAGRVGALLGESGFGDVRVDGATVRVSGLGLARRFPEALALVEKAGGTVRDVRYRGNTLEDVFIALTGRGLRE